MYSYVAKQPILDKKQKYIADELFFRSGETNCFPVDIGASEATCKLLLDNFVNLNVTNNKALTARRFFINFDYDSLLSYIPTLFPKDRIIIEILETVPPSSDLLKVVVTLYKLGYVLALDDYVPSGDWDKFLPYIKIIKLDIESLGLENCCNYIKKFREKHSYKIKFLAERVETYGDFTIAAEGGFDFFQGYYFSKPKIIQNKIIDRSQITALQLIYEANQDIIDFDKIESIIKQDASLSYLLLKFVNSKFSQKMEEISSIKQAFVYLGEEQTRSFVCLISTANIAKDKPRAVFDLSLTRALACSAFSGLKNTQSPVMAKFAAQEAFLTGILSLIDALMDYSKEEALEGLPLSSKIKDAILKQKGELGLFLNLIQALEIADWNAFSKICEELEVEEEKVTEAYHESLRELQRLLN